MAKKLGILVFCLALMLCLAGCGKAENNASASKSEVSAQQQSASSDENKEAELKLYFNNEEIPVTWENNATVDELRAQVLKDDITVNMSMYSNNEQVGSLGKSYQRNDAQMTTQSGDIVLYNGNQIVVFYGSNSWAYTKLGKMNLPDKEVTKRLSNGNITLTLKA